MPINDYECPVCGRVDRDVSFSGRGVETAPPPLCGTCGSLMQWLPAKGHGGISQLKGFEVDGQPVTSLRQADQIERETAQRARDGEGVSPIRFRALHQDPSNMDRNTFGPKPDQSVPLNRRGQRFPLRAIPAPEIDEE